VNILVDTTIWSLALRRRRLGFKEKILVDELAELVLELRAVLIGPVRQEVLSGIPDPKDFEVVRQHLAAFSDLPIVEEDYEEAARVFNACRKKGVQGSHVDFLICAIALRHSAAVFTTDKDFTNYAKHLNLKLHKPRKG
jgi:predicted nucleic acid-binding protein